MLHYHINHKYKFYLEVKALLEKMKASGEYKGGLQKGIAEILNVTKRQVARYSSIEKLPAEIQNDVLEGKITLNQALEYSTASSPNISQTGDTFKKISEMLSGLSNEERETVLFDFLGARTQKDDIGHHFEQTDYVSAPKMENTGSEKDDIGHHFEADSNTSPEFPDIQMQARSPSTESKSKENGSVLIFKDGMFIPNKIQVIEEHESYTVFKVFAVKQ